ncbi:MAG: protein tyrosine phosphatase family protein [Pseudomonadales bacterium]|jgi:protein tyrosine phosphatase (PTP) superfamily phosphohydrolase (DUF442 family)|nr:protein tyrosine phosphatase family protein [Pseudomonadales bacterium]
MRGLVLAVLLMPVVALGGDDGIFNYRELDGTLSTAGQVTDEQVPQLAEDGYGLVVNLAVADPERNANEGFLVSQAGIAYAQIPVVWDTPTLEDLELFFAVMDARGERRTLVHCFANFRASAFTYLYRILRLGVPEAEARADLESIWTEEAWAEYPQWAEFIELAQTRYGAR